jgi:cephalosporin-C deacetylase
MNAVDPQIQMTPSEFQAPNAECFDLTFTGVRNTRVFAKYVRPVNIKSKCPAIIEFHGYSGSSGGWPGKLAFVNAGYCVLSLDCRGQGGKSNDNAVYMGTTFRGNIVRGLGDPDPQNLAFRHMFLDTAQIAKIAIENIDEIDGERVGCMGGSQGGALTYACASLEPRIKRCAPAVPFLSDYKRVWNMDLDQNAYEELRYFFMNFDPEHKREDEIFTTLGYISVHHLAPRIKATMLQGSSLRDNICPPSTQFAAYNNVLSEKSMCLYPDFGHGLPAAWDDSRYLFMTQL